MVVEGDELAKMAIAVRVYIDDARCSFLQAAFTSASLAPHND